MEKAFNRDLNTGSEVDDLIMTALPMFPKDHIGDPIGLMCQPECQGY